MRRIALLGLFLAVSPALANRAAAAEAEIQIVEAMREVDGSLIACGLHVGANVGDQYASVVLWTLGDDPSDWRLMMRVFSMHIVEPEDAPAKLTNQRVARALVKNPYFSSFGFKLAGSPVKYSAISRDARLIVDAIPSMIDDGASFMVQSMEFATPLTFTLPGDGLYSFVLDDYLFCMEQMLGPIPEDQRPTSRRQ